MLTDSNNHKLFSLHLETARTTAPTGLFELASLAAHVGFDVGVSVRVGDGRGVSKVRQGLAGFGSTQQNRVGSLGGAERELIEGDALATGGRDALAGRFRKGQRADGQILGAFQHSDVVRNFSNNDGGLAFFLGHVFGEAVQTHGGLIDLAHVQAFQDGAAEMGVCSA